MKIVFFGYRTWALEILKNLQKVKSEEISIVLVITNKNPEGDFPNSIKTDPNKLDDKELLQQIKTLNPDILLFYGWSWIIPKELYEKYLSLILHPSPLPKYRGGSPIQHQVINGEKESAVTLLRVTEKIDSGPIYSQSNFSLSGNMQQIFDRITTIGTHDTIKVIHELINKTHKPREQNESEASFFKRRRPEESEISIKDFQEKTAEELYNFIRALADPYPNAFIKCRNGKKLFFKEATIE